MKFKFQGERSEGRALDQHAILHQSLIELVVVSGAAECLLRQSLRAAAV